MIRIFSIDKKPIKWSSVVYLGAKSTWLTTYPARQSPVNITASDSSATAMSRWSHDVYPTATSRAPAPINATQNQEKKKNPIIKHILNVVVNQRCLARTWQDRVSPIAKHFWLLSLFDGSGLEKVLINCPWRVIHGGYIGIFGRDH